jgi:hypothetical protein
MSSLALSMGFDVRNGSQNGLERLLVGNTYCVVCHAYDDASWTTMHMLQDDTKISNMMLAKEGDRIEEGGQTRAIVKVRGTHMQWSSTKGIVSPMSRCLIFPPSNGTVKALHKHKEVLSNDGAC